jgi:GT2 family glycosyltransferase
MENRTLDIVIINWNAGAQLMECLKSVVSAEKDGFTLTQVIVVDNASADDSLNGLESLELPLKIIENTENLGFGAACNQGAEISKADYCCF